MNWGVVLLAAGMSERMGGPKLLLPWSGTTVLGQVMKTLAEALGDRRPSFIVVVGGYREAIRAEVERVMPDAECAFNPDYRNGEMMDSLRVGIGTMGKGIERALIALGDQPQMSVAAARAVIETAERSALPIAAPVNEGNRGHPWSIARDLWEELCRAKTARGFLDSRGAEIAAAETDESALKDLDYPEDYRRDAPG